MIQKLPNRTAATGAMLGVLAALAAGSATRADVVILADGDRIAGSLVILSPDAVEIEDTSGTSRKLKITEVRQISFDGEPAKLGDARGLLLRRDAPGALAELAKIEKTDLDAADPRIREEHEYLTLAATAQAAATADGPAAALALDTYLGRNARSHHLYEGREILGDLLARLGRFDEAAAAYRELDRGPPALRVRGAASRARLLLHQGKPAEAKAEFAAAASIPIDQKDSASAAQKGEAELGVARCLALTGMADEGIAAARGVIRKADPGDHELLAAAFGALGQCQRAAGGKDEDALISFLTVDLVYNRVPELHAEALANLVELWEATKRPERAREARQALLSTYPKSEWARKLGGQGSS